MIPNRIQYLNADGKLVSERVRRMDGRDYITASGKIVSPTRVTGVDDSEPQILTDEDFAVAASAGMLAALVGLQIDTPCGEGTVVQVPAGIFAKVALSCHHDGCPKQYVAHLDQGAPGLCYVVDPDTRAFIADLRNDVYVCPEHRS